MAVALGGGEGNSCWELGRGWPFQCLGSGARLGTVRGAGKQVSEMGEVIHSPSHALTGASGAGFQLSSVVTRLWTWPSAAWLWGCIYR